MNAHRGPRGVVGWLNRTFRYWSLAPAVLLFAVLTVYPVLNLFRMSVSTIQFKGNTDFWAFTPRRNWDALFRDSPLSPVAPHTLLFVAVAVTVEMLLGLALALLVARMIRGK